MATRARIATVCLARYPGSTVAQMRERTLSLLSVAACGGSDLVALPEMSTNPNAHTMPNQVAETVPGPTVDGAAKIAREHRCYVICPLLTKRDGEYRNSAVLIGRGGEIVGIYDKLQPVTSSADYTVFEDGITPGRELPVFDLDFGRVGIQICFDIGFPQNWAKLGELGARAVFWCSAYNGGFPLQAYAAIHGYHVITSVRTDKARFIDPCGTVRAESDGLTNVIWRDVNLDFAVCHSDFNYSIPDLVAAKYGPRVSVRGDGDAGSLLIEPVDPNITIAQLQQEFGFETRGEYFKRHQCGYDAMRSGTKSSAQKALHGERPMYAKW